MNYQILRKVAEGMENALLEGQVLHTIGNYSIDIVPDDDKIEIHYSRIKPLKHIETTFTLKGAAHQ